MPFKTPEQRKQYIREWKEKKRRSLGIQPRKKTSLDEKRERQKLNQKKYREQNRDKINERNRNNRSEYVDKHPAKRMLWAAKRRSKERGLNFDLVESDLVLPELCPYLKTPLISKSNRGEGRECVYSLDRIDTSKGYTKDNVEVVSHLANTMKNAATKEQLIEFSKTILIRNGYFVGKSSDPRY